MTSNNRHQPLPFRSWFLFNTWFSLLVVLISTAATLHIPISRVALPILVVGTGSVLFLVIRTCRTKRTQSFSWQPILTSVLILAAVLVVLWGSLTKNEFVSVLPDPWAYTAFATYVQNPVPAIAVDGVQPVLSFGRGLMGARFGTAGSLAFFAQITRTDPCRAASIYAFFVFLQTGFGFTLLARIFGSGRILSVVAGVFAVTLGWAPEILKIGNWDQLLFLSFIPFALLRLRFLTFKTSRRPGMLGLGLCLGAVAFAYPEGAAISGSIYLPLLVWRLFRGSDRPGKIRRLAAAAGVGILASGVYLPRFVIFLNNQIISGTTDLNAKGTLAGLLSARWLPAIYALGEQAPVANTNSMELVVPLMFFGLSLLALRTWWIKKDGILLTLPVFFALTIWQARSLGYDYGFYKVLTMFWPVMVIAIFVGMSRLLAWSSPGLVRSLVAAVLCGLLIRALVDQSANFQYAPWHQERRINPFLELKGLKTISGNASICLLSQSSFDQMWAVFFLQGYKLVIPHPLGHLRHASSGLHDVPIGQSGRPFILVDQQRPGAIWHNEVFSLLDKFDPIELLSVDAPNRLETVQGDSFVWLNNQFTDFRIYSDKNRQAILKISECWPGPSRPEEKRRTLVVEVNGLVGEFPTLSNLKVPLKLNLGENLIRLKCKESATVERLPSGDTRKLLLGIKGFGLTQSDPVELLGIDAPNGVESVRGEPFVWLDNRFAELQIQSDENRQSLLLISECWPGPSRPGDEHRTLIAEVNGEKVEVTASSNLRIPLKLTHGNNVVRLSCKEAPTVDKLSSGDVRTLLLGIKGFKFATHEEPVEISAIESPNRVEEVEGNNFIWLSNRTADLTIHSETKCTGLLSIQECWPGPSRPEDKSRTLVMELNGVKTEWAASSNLKVPLKLVQGNNLIKLSCKEIPTVDKLSSGDTRTLLLGIKGFSVTACK